MALNSGSVGTELGEESATVHVVVRPDAVERGYDAGIVLFSQQPAQQRDAVDSSAGREGELERAGVIQHLVGILLGDCAGSQAADRNASGDAPDVVSGAAGLVSFPQSCQRGHGEAGTEVLGDSATCELRGEVVQVVGSPFVLEQRAQMFLTCATTARGDAAFGGANCLEEFALVKEQTFLGLGIEIIVG